MCNNFFKEQGTIENKVRILKSKINECLRQQGAESNYEFDIRLGIVVTLEYSDSNNDANEQQYIVYLGETPYCKAIEGEAVHCDQYCYLEYGNEEQGEEYRDISALCYRAYCDLPQGDMATRYGRNAGDALKIGLEEGVEYAQLIIDFNISNEGYITSFHYRDCKQELADGCYWAGENYYQFLYHYTEATDHELV